MLINKSNNKLFLIFRLAYFLSIVITPLVDNAFFILHSEI